MTFDLNRAFADPDFDRSEMRLYIAHPKMPGAGATAYYIGVGVESMEHTIATETTEKPTIAQRLPTITNKDGGITFPTTFEMTKGNPAYDAIVAAGLLGKVNEEFVALAVYGNIGVKQSGTLVADAPFAQKAKAKIAMSSIGGAGTEKISVTAEVKTSGDIDRGYIKLEDGGDVSYDPDEETWVLDAFTAVPTLDIGDLVIGAASA